MSYKNSLNLSKDILFLGKKTKYLIKAAREETKINKNLVYKSTNNLARPDIYLDKSHNFYEKKLIFQNCHKSHKKKNKVFENSFCFICGIFVEDDQYNYLLNPLQKQHLINELNKYGVILSKKKEDEFSLKQQKDIKIRICNNCHLSYFKIIKPFLKQGCEINIIKLKDNNSKSQIENPKKKEVNFSLMSTNNCVNEILNSKLFNNNNQDNIDIKLNNCNISDKINAKNIIDNNNNFINNISKLDLFHLTKLNQNQEKDKINKDLYINGLNNNYLEIINNTSNKTLNSEKDNNNLYSKMKNINPNNIMINLNKNYNSNNNLNYAPKTPLIIQNYNIKELNSVNMFQNLKPNISNNSFINDLNIKKNDDSFLNYIDMIQKLNTQNIKQNNILINNKYDKLFHIFQLFSKYLISDFDVEKKLSITNDIETLTNVFSQIIIKFNRSKNDDDTNKKLTEDNNNNNEIKKKDEKIDEDKSLKKENHKKNIGNDYDIFMSDILKMNEAIKNNLNAIKINEEIRKIYILILLKNIKFFLNPSINIIQNKDKTPTSNGMNLEQINNGSYSNFKINNFSEKIINDLNSNLIQINKVKNKQDLFPLSKEINPSNFNSKKYENGKYLNDNIIT